MIDASLRNTTRDLFSTPADRFDQIDIPDAGVRYYPQLFSKDEAAGLFDQLQREISWKQERITLYGKTYDVPRLTAWYGEPNKTYTYSGIKAESSPWNSVLLEIKTRVEAVSNTTFNSVLLNRYRDGSDAVAWHADDEPELGTNPVIGSVSFGEERPFQMKHKTDKAQKQEIALESGSYLLMKGATQHHWLHRIPKTKRRIGERINLTFRSVGLPYV